MASIRIRIGAALDANALTVLVPLQREVAKARASIEKDLNKIPKALAAGPYRTNARAAATEVEKIGKAAKDTGGVVGTVTSDAARGFKNLAASAKTLTPTLASVSREAQRELAKIEKANARATLGLGSGGGGGGSSQFGRRVGYWSMRNLSPVTPTLSIAKRMGGELLRGAGIQTDVSSFLQSYISRQSLAQQIVNSGYQPGVAGAAGKLQNAGDLSREASQIGMATGYDPTKALEGLQEFVKKTGDLDTGRKVMGDLAKMSNATGTNLEDMVSAAGDVSNALGDIPEKGERIKDVMRAIAGQGKLGAVEISDMAKQMAALAAVAPQMTGDTSSNIGLMGALAQEARQHGGAKSAAQATTSVMSFVNTFSKGARVKEFNALGISTTDSKTGKIRNPEEIILEALLKTSGKNGKVDTLKMGKLFADVRARTAVRGFENIYNTAGGGAAGAKAVSAEFDRLKKATLDQAEVERANSARMEDADKKAQVFQNQLQEIADHVATKLLPAMEQLEPKARQIAEAFGNFISWATANPGKAIEVAIAASIAKAGLENIFRTAIEKGASGGGGALANIGAALTIATMAIAAVTIGEATIDNFFAKKSSEQKTAVENLFAADNAMGAAAGAAITPEQKAELEKQQRINNANIQRTQAEMKAGPGALQVAAFAANNLIHPIAGPKQMQEAIEKDKAEHERLLVMQIEEQKRLRQVMERIANGTIKVQPVGNGGAAPVDQSGRQPANSPAPK